MLKDKNKKMQRTQRLTFLVILSFSLSAIFSCAVFAAPPVVAFVYEPSHKNVERLKAADICTVNIGNFSIGPKAPSKIDLGIPYRSSKLISPVNNSFAQYLRDAIETEFKMANKLDANATLVITGQLTKNDIDATHMSIGRGEIGAKIQLRKADLVVFDKELVVDSIWQAMMGIEQGSQVARIQYAALYQLLIAKLISDPDFVRVCAK